jgi:hypothetical protein
MSKIPKELLDAMTKHSVNISLEKKSETDFTSKNKISFKEKVKNYINGLLSKVKKSKLLTNIKNWFNNKFIKPLQDRKARKKHEKYVKELKTNFSKKFNVDVEKTIKIMNQSGYSPLEVDNDKLLVENRIEINKRKSLYTFAPFMYNPEVVDIHNENLNKNNLKIDEIRANEYNKVNDTLDKQLEFFRKRPHLTVGGRKSSDVSKSTR